MLGLAEERGVEPLLREAVPWLRRLSCLEGPVRAKL